MKYPANPDFVYINTPYIAEYKNFITAEEIDQILSLCKDLTWTAGECRIAGKKQLNLDQRLAFNHRIQNSDSPVLTQWLPRVARWLDLPNEQWIEAGLVVHYPPQGEFKLHSDVVCTTLPDGKPCWRTASLIVYLNDSFSNGRTVFPVHRVAVTPEAGKALLFCYDYNEEINRSTVHYSQLVTQDKYILVFFIRDQEYPESFRSLSNY